jgi:hypothetical protein
LSNEGLVLDIDDDYKNLAKSFEKWIKSLEGTSVIVNAFQNDLDELFSEVSCFQRKLEYDIKITDDYAKKTTYYKRLTNRIQNTLNLLTSNQTVVKIPGIAIPYVDFLDPKAPKEVSTKGVIPTLRDASECLVRHEFQAIAKARLLSFAAYYTFKTAKLDIEEIKADLRLVNWLTISSFDSKIRLKNNLSSQDFKGVVISLDQAELNLKEAYLHEEHRKDCIHQCRDALEHFIATARINITNEGTENKFSFDLEKLMEIGMLDEETKTLTNGVYSFCSSDKGSHKFRNEKVSIDDCLEAMQETHLILEILLKRYLLIKKV